MHDRRGGGCIAAGKPDLTTGTPSRQRPRNLNNSPQTPAREQAGLGGAC